MNMMKVLLAIAVLGMTLSAVAAPSRSPTSQPMALVGKIVSNDGSGNIVVAAESRHGSPGGQVTVATDANTQVTLDGKASTVASLVAGLWARVVPPTGTATLIAAFTPRPQPVEGKLVTNDGSGNLVIQTEGQRGQPGAQATVVTDANTQITLDGKTAAVADLKPGVFVKVLPATGTATSIAAFTPPQHPLEGKLVTNDGSGNLVVQPEGRHGQGGGQVTVATDANTQITLDGKTAAVADLKPGVFVKVLPATGTAASIAARTPQQHPLEGKLVTNDGSGNLVVLPVGHRGQGGQVTVATDANTQITLDGKTAAVADLKPGVFVKVLPGTGTATSIVAMTPQSRPVFGKIVGINGSVLTVATMRSGGTPVSVTGDAGTVVTIDGKTAVLAGLQVGMVVEVKLNAAGTAAEIHAKSLTPPASQPSPAAKGGMGGKPMPAHR